MEKLKTMSLKMPEEVYKEILLRIPEGERSSFIREAIIEKLEKTPKPDRILELEERMATMEKEFTQMKKNLLDLELLTFERERIDLNTFCTDEIDEKIIGYLTHYKGATTPELAKYTKTNRWLILNRLRRIQKKSEKRLGKPIVSFHAEAKSGKQRAWWIHEELIQV